MARSLTDRTNYVNWTAKEKSIVDSYCFSLYNYRITGILQIMLAVNQFLLTSTGGSAMGKVIGNVMVQKRGVISLGLLKEYMPLSDGEIFQVQIEDRKIILVPMKLIPAEQAWFWTREWQAGEKEADEDIATGRVKTFDSVDDLLEELDQ